MNAKQIFWVVFSSIIAVTLLASLAPASWSCQSGELIHLEDGGEWLVEGGKWVWSDDLYPQISEWSSIPGFIGYADLYPDQWAVIHPLGITESIDHGGFILSDKSYSNPPKITRVKSHEFCLTNQ